MSRLHPVSYGAGVLLASGLVQPRSSRRSRRQARARRSRSPAVHAFDTPGKTRLRVKNAAGLISVEPSETGRTTVELEALRDDDATREAIERATVEMNGNEVTVEIGVGSKGFGVGPAWISFGRTPAGRHPHPLSRGHRPRLHDRLRRRRSHRPARRRGVEDRLRRHRRRARRGASRPVGERGRPWPRPSTARRDIQTVSGDVRLGTVTGPVSATLVSGDFAVDEAHIGPGGQDRLRRPADRRDPRGADQAPVGLGRRPARRPPRHAPADRRQLDERRRQLRARRQGPAVREPDRLRGAAAGQDRQRRHRDHPGRGRLCLR